MPTRINDLNGLVRTLLENFSIEKIERQTGIRAADLERWRQGGNHYSPAAEERLYG